MNHIRSESGSIEVGIGALVAAFVALLVLGLPIYTVACYQNEHTITCTVTDKDRTTKPKGGSDMRVYTEDCGNLSVQDATFKKNFHASDTYREIEVGKTYEFTVNGYRIPFLSEFPNILSAEQVSA